MALRLDANDLCVGLLSGSIRGAVVLGCAALLCLLLRRASAAVRHRVWGLAVLGLLLLPALGALLPRWELAVLSPGTPETVPALLSRFGGKATPAATAQAAARSGGATPGALDAGGAGPAGPAGAPGRGARWLLGLLGAGTAGGLLWLLLGWIGVRRLLRDARPVDDPGDDPAWTGLLRELGQELGLSSWRRVRLLKGPRRLTPLTTGTLHPVILLPADAEEWSAGRRRAILLHELGHVRRCDCLFQTLAQVACALHWFNPLAWFAAHKMRAEREVAADDLVLAAGTRASDYATHLLEIAASRCLAGRGLGASLAASVASAGHGSLEARLRTILDGRRDHRPLSPRFALYAWLGALGLVLPVACVAAGAEGTAKAAWAADPGPAPSAASAGAGAIQVLRSQVEAYLGHGGAPVPLPAGHTVELTIDPAVQAFAEEELDALAGTFRPTGATILVLDPATGEILALAGRTRAVSEHRGHRPGPEAAVLGAEAAYVPGSTMKVFTVAAALEQGTITEDQWFATENGRWKYEGGVLTDVTPSSRLRVADILAVSSNIGAAKIYKTLGKEALGRALFAFHFGERPGVELPGAWMGALSPAAGWSELQATSIAMGHGLSASPLQVAAAFAAIANEGVYHAPALLRRVVGPGGSVVWRHKPAGEGVVRPATARAVLRMLEGVVQRDDGTGPRARIPGYRVAGKTGTALLTAEGAKDERYYASFVGAVPASRPRVVILVGAEGMQGDHVDHTGGRVAAPAFRRVGERVLAHLGVPRDQAD